VIVSNGTDFYLAGRETNGGMAQTGNQYFVRIESLDTGETADYPIRLVYNNIPGRVDRRGAATSIDGRTKKPTASNPPKLPVRRNWQSDGQLPRTASTAGHVSTARGFSPTGVGQ
jgi:hypothetical protein